MKYYQSKPIKDWVAEDQPREKILSKGIASLTEAELIATLLSSGSRELSAIDMGRKLLEDFGGLSQLARASVKDLMKIKGIGKAKAVSVASAFELARRKMDLKWRRERVTSSYDIAAYFRSRLMDLDHEEFFALYLNPDCAILGVKQVSKGGINSTAIDPRIVYREALNLSASCLVFCHNHPSGNLRPSRADDALTDRLCQAAGFFDMKVLDHVIVSYRGYYSYNDQGKLRYSSEDRRTLCVTSTQPFSFTKW